MVMQKERDCGSLSKTSRARFQKNVKEYSSEVKSSPLTEKILSSSEKQAYFAVALLSENYNLEFVLDSAVTDQNFQDVSCAATVAEGTTKILLETLSLQFIQVL